MEKSKFGMSPEKASEVFSGHKDSKLKRLRVKNGLSQSELAKASDVTLRAIQCYEQGARDIHGARLDTLCKLAECLGCTIADLLEDDQLIDMYKNVK